MSKPKSDSLFHFTKNIDFLKSILLNGIYPRYCLEDVAWLGLDEQVAYPMVCFCDIPLSRINEHTDFYGSYGIGLSKSWGLRNGLTPVIYCSNRGFVSDLALFLFNENGKETDENRKAREVACFKLLKLVKPLNGKMVIRGTMIDKEFYQESEWRYTPIDKIEETAIFQADFDKEKDAKNLEAEAFKLQFLPSDIKYIFVKEDHDIPPIVDFINNNLGKYPLNDLKILNSRIVSLATVEADL